jgi:hypothetical protein
MQKDTDFSKKLLAHNIHFLAIHHEEVEKSSAAFLSDIHQLVHINHSSLQPYENTTFLAFQYQNKLLVFVDHYQYLKLNLILNSDFFIQFIHHQKQKGLAVYLFWQHSFQFNCNLFSQRLAMLLGIKQNIYARLTQVTPISIQEAADFFNQYHEMQYAAGAFAFGLIFQNHLVAAALFGKKRKMTYQEPHFYSIELLRYTSLPGKNVVGGLSKLISFASKKYNCSHVMTYASNDWGQGSSYRKLNFQTSEVVTPFLTAISRSTSQIQFLSLKKSVQFPENDFFYLFNAGSLKCTQFL